MRSSCVLYLVVVSMVVLSQAILCPVVCEWWAGADWLWEKSSGLCKWSLEWDSCSLILLIKGRFVCQCSHIDCSSHNHEIRQIHMKMYHGFHSGPGCRHLSMGQNFKFFFICANL